MDGIIINSFGRGFIVKAQNNLEYNCVTRGKKTEFVVGDIVEISIINDSQAQINRLISRKNLVYRSSLNRTKIIASNVDQLLIVIAIKPNFNPQFLDRALIFAESEEITPLIIVNKYDLKLSRDFFRHIEEQYSKTLNYKVIKLSTFDKKLLTELKDNLSNKQSLLIGQSGVGKSTIINHLIDYTQTKTGEISKSEASGCHTTTNASLYYIDNNSTLIDCPGLQEFGLMHLKGHDLTQYFPELKDLPVACRFNNCRHLKEPECKMNWAYMQNLITEERFKVFKQLNEEVK